nr:ATP-dependent DNA helicase [Rikenellaceae bacterium]
MTNLDILQGLNEAQRAAVVNFDRPSLIIAGAGSGKTRVLTSRIAYMIAQGIEPWSILALTFTNKAAAEMRTRIEQMVGPKSRYIRMGTFHSVFARILRENAERIGFPQSFTIYEPNDVKNLLKTIVKEMNLPDEKYKPNLLASRISYAKNALITPGAYLAKSIYAAEDRQAQIPEFGNIYNEYCRRCKRNGAMDFDDLLLQTNILLKEAPEVLARYQELFQYILVDEYQDTNYAQYIIIRRLSQQHGRVCVVGDDAQSIYSFRGAKIENILSFQNDYPTAEVFKLEQNYRSTRTIVEAANSLIEKNARRMKKTCFSEGDVGEKIRILRAYTDREEAELVVGDLRDKVRQANEKWSEAVILYRTNNQSAVLEDNLRRRGIPYRIYKGASFYDHKEIRDLMGYIRLVINPRDDEAFKRIINYPARGIGDTTVDRIAQLATTNNLSMWEAVDRLVAESASVTCPMQRAIVRKVTDFVQMIRALSMAGTTMGLYEFGMEIAVRSGILALYRAENTPEAQSAIANIEELLNSMQEFKERREAEIRNGEREVGEEPTIEEWLQEVMLMTDADKDDPEDNNKVTLMTVHSAKGLEYKFVYIVGLEENLFPSQRALETPDGLEEERRLFYVALTRAKCSAVISYAEMRFKWGNMEFSRPSSFLREIDPRYIDSEVDFTARQTRPEPEGEQPKAIDELRRRFDYRFQQKRQEEGGRYGARPSDGESSSARRFTRQNDPYRKPQSTSYPHPKTQFNERLERAINALGQEQRRTLRAIPTATPSSASATPSAGGYTVGERVEHTLFGRGEIIRIEYHNGDQKLTVEFQNREQKTLLAKFAKLRKL